MVRPSAPAIVALTAMILSAGAQANFFADPGEYMVQGNPEAAARHLQAGAERGEASAMFALAHLYRTGAGVAKDPTRSTALYLQAAELGHVDAQYMAGVCYERGRGVDKDIGAARQWFERASRSGHEDARQRLARLEQPVAEGSTVPVGELIRTGNLVAVESLLQSGTSPNERDLMDTPPLHLAAMHGQTRILEVLIARGAQLDAIDANQDTALHIAAVQGDPSSYGILLEAGADPDVSNRAGWSARQLRARGAPSPAPTATVSRTQRLAGFRQDPRFKGWSTLSIAAWTGDAKTIRELTQRDAHFAADATGYSPLARAVQNHQLQAARLLLEIGAGTAESTSPPLTQLAVAADAIELLNLLIAHDVPLDQYDTEGATALQRAIRARRGGIAITLLDAGADPGLAGQDGITPLMLAVEAGDVSLAARIMRTGVDLTATDPQARTALHYAAASSCNPAVFGPLAAMLPLDPDADGRWPLHLAADAECAALVDALLQRGHSVDVVSLADNTPLALSAARGASHIVRMLLAQDADPNRRDRRGGTPLHRAVEGGHAEAVALLLDAGANPSIRNNNALNAFDLSTDPVILDTLNGERPALFASFE